MEQINNHLSTMGYSTKYQLIKGISFQFHSGGNVHKIETNIYYEYM